MKIDSRTKGFSFNEKKDILTDLKIIAKAKGTTVADMIRASNRRLIKANKHLLEKE